METTSENGLSWLEIIWVKFNFNYLFRRFLLVINYFTWESHDQQGIELTYVSFSGPCWVKKEEIDPNKITNEQKG